MTALETTAKTIGNFENKQNGLYTEKELSMVSVEFWKLRQFVFWKETEDGGLSD